MAVNSEIPCKLEMLDLSENCFNGIGVVLLGPLLTLSSLTRLMLSKLNLGDSGVCVLIDVLCGSSCAGSLGIAQDGTTPEQTPSVSASNKQNVTFLDLGHNSIRTKGANAIARLISTSNCLVHLELGWNAIGPSSSSVILKSLHKNSTITFLGLSWNGLDEAGGIALASLISVSTFIKTLDVGHNRITMLATCLIASALRQNTSIRCLILAGNLIGKIGCKAIFRVLRWQHWYRRSKYLEQLASERKQSEYSLNLDTLKSSPIVESVAAFISVDACVFDDQNGLDLGLHNCNGDHTLNMKNLQDRAKLAELMELSYVVTLPFCMDYTLSSSTHLHQNLTRT